MYRSAAEFVMRRIRGMSRQAAPLTLHFFEDRHQLKRQGLAAMRRKHNHTRYLPDQWNAPGGDPLGGQSPLSVFVYPADATRPKRSEKKSAPKGAHFNFFFFDPFFDGVLSRGYRTARLP